MHPLQSRSRANTFSNAWSSSHSIIYEILQPLNLIQNLKNQKSNSPIPKSLKLFRACELQKGILISEVRIMNDKNVRRRFRASNYQESSQSQTSLEHDQIQTIHLHNVHETIWGLKSFSIFIIIFQSY